MGELSQDQQATMTVRSANNTTLFDRLLTDMAESGHTIHSWNVVTINNGLRFIALFYLNDEWENKEVN